MYFILVICSSACFIFNVNQNIWGFVQFNLFCILLYRIAYVNFEWILARKLEIKMNVVWSVALPFIFKNGIKIAEIKQ